MFNSIWLIRWQQFYFLYLGTIDNILGMFALYDFVSGFV